MNVGRLHVAVEDPLLVRVVEAAADLGDDPELLLTGQAVGGDHRVGEVAAFEKLHGDEEGVFGLAQLVDRDDVRMLELGRGPGLPLEAREGIPLGQKARVDRLQGHEALEHRVAGFVDRAHGPLAELSEHLVLADLPAQRGPRSALMILASTALRRTQQGRPEGLDAPTP
jgi:hypothetical protein